MGDPQKAPERKENVVDRRSKLEAELEEKREKLATADEDIANIEVEISAAQGEVDALQRREKQARPHNRRTRGGCWHTSTTITC